MSVPLSLYVSVSGSLSLGLPACMLVCPFHLAACRSVRESVSLPFCPPVSCSASVSVLASLSLSLSACVALVSGCASFPSVCVLVCRCLCRSVSRFLCLCRSACRLACLSSRLIWRPVGPSVSLSLCFSVCLSLALPMSPSPVRLVCSSCNEESTIAGQERTGVETWRCRANRECERGA